MKYIKSAFPIFALSILCSCTTMEDLSRAPKKPISPNAKISLVNTFQNSFNSSTAVNGMMYIYSGNNQKCLDKNNLISLGSPTWGRYTLVNQYKNFLFSFQPQQKIEDAFKNKFKNINVTSASFNNDSFQPVLNGLIAADRNQNIKNISEYLSLSPFTTPNDVDYVVVAYPDVGSQLSIRDGYGADHSYARAIGFGGYFNDRSALGSLMLGLFSHTSKPFAYADADKIHFNIGILVFDAKQKKFTKHFSHINEFSFASKESELNKLLFNSSTGKNNPDEINHMCEFSDAQIGIIDRFMQEKINETLEKVTNDITTGGTAL